MHNLYKFTPYKVTHMHAWTQTHSSAPEINRTLLNQADCCWKGVINFKLLASCSHHGHRRAFCIILSSIQDNPQSNHTLGNAVSVHQIQESNRLRVERSCPPVAKCLIPKLHCAVKGLCKEEDLEL